MQIQGLDGTAIVPVTALPHPFFFCIYIKDTKIRCNAWLCTTLTMATDIRIPVIFGDFFSALLPEKASLFTSPEKKNVVEKVISSCIKDLIVFGKQRNGKTFGNYLKKEKVENLINIDKIMSFIFNENFKEGISWHKIIHFVIIASEFIECLEEKTDLQFSAEQVFKACIELMEAQVKDWIQRAGIPPLMKYIR